MPLSSDRPKTNPKEDLFGHAPFAEQLADAVKRQNGEDGLVLALYGPWGSGKSTVLGYVRHFLSSEQASGKLVLVEFNPWWFAGREDLAQAFLRQLQAVLPRSSEGLRKLAEQIGDFSESVGFIRDLLARIRPRGRDKGH
jgi:predicted KAP-like P-loop ATPase